MPGYDSLLTEGAQAEEPKKKKKYLSGDKNNLLNDLVDKAFLQELKMSNPEMKTRIMLKMTEMLQNGQNAEPGSLATEGANDEETFFQVANDTSQGQGIRQPDRDRAVAKKMSGIYKQLAMLSDDQVKQLLKAGKNGY